MGRFEDYIEAVTRRLRPDPELHMDVAREVRAHLEDAAEEARARGLSDEEAAEAALAAFGEADEIAGALWEANRGRMRLRAVLKWAARGTLLPAALLVAVYICITYFGGLCQVTTAAAAWDLDLPWPGKVLPRWGPIDLRPRGNLSPEERLEFKLISRKRSDAEALLELDPLDPSFHAHYVLLLARDRWNRQESLGAEEVKETLAVLKRARSIEPDNAYYNYLAASLLMERSSMLDYNGGIGVKYTGRAGQEMVVNIGRLVMDDPVTFEQGVSELFEGMSKPYYSAHTFDMVRRKISLAKPPTTLADELRLWFFVAATPLPHLASLRAMGRRVAAYSALLAQEGRHEEAIEMIEAMDRPGVQMGAGAQTVIELSTSQGHIQMALGQAAGIYERMDMQDRAALAQQRSEMESERWNSIWRKHEDGEIPQENLKHYGFVHVALAPSLPGVDHSLWGGPSTALEHILAEGLALAVLEVLLLLLALRCAVATCWNLWRYRKRADGPKLFFIGWRRMAGIVLLGLVLPIGVYAAYSRLAPFSSMRYGIHYRLDRVLIEKGTLVALVLIVVLATSYRAIRARCRDAGMDVPSEGFFNPLRSLAVMIGLALLAAAITAHFLVSDDAYLRYLLPNFLGGCLAALVVLLALLYILWQFWLMKRRHPGNAHFRTSFVRSLLPILTACLLLLGLSSRGFLRSVEARYVAQLNRPGAVWGLDELENSALKGYRDHLRELNRTWNQERGIEGAEPQTNADDPG